MRLRHQPLEVVHEPFAAELGVLVVSTHVDRLLRAHLLAIAAEDAAELVDLEYEGIAIALLVLARHELDAVGRADGRAETAGDALRLPILRREHAMRAAPALADGLFLLRILRRDLLGIEHVLQRVRHAREGGTHVARLLGGTRDDLDADGHQSPDSGRRGTRWRAAATPRSRSMSRWSSRDDAGLMIRPRSRIMNRMITATMFSMARPRWNGHEPCAKPSDCRSTISAAMATM